MQATTKKAVAIGDAPITDIKVLPKSKIFLLGFQHTFAMFGATVLVPILTGLNINTALFMAGVGTLIFHFFTKGKVPAFLGSSFAFIGGYNLVAPVIDGKADVNQLAMASGGIFCAGLIYLVLAALIKAFGIKRVMRYFPPVVTGPIIIAIGLTLSPSAVANASQNWLLAIIAIVTIVICNIWGKGMLKIIPIIMGIFVAYLVAVVTNNVDFSVFNNLQIISMPIYKESIMQFDLSAILTIIPISLATMMEHIGDISAISATTGQNYIADPGLHRTLLGDGIATSVSAVFGGPANTTYGENTGVLALTKVYDPKVMRLAACIAIVLSCVPVLSTFIQTIPTAVIGGVSLILYGMIAAIGARNLVENQVDFTKSRNLIIAATILVVALGFTNGISFTVAGVVINLSGIAISAILGIALNAILPGKDYIFTTANPKDTGVNFSGVDTTRKGHGAPEDTDEE